MKNLFIILSLFLAVAYAWKDNQFIDLEKEKTALANSSVQKSDSIKDLRATLALELDYHCDTMTIDEKVKETKLRDYDLKVWTENERKKTESFDSKQKADLATFQKKEAASMKAFNVYMKENSLRLMAWSKEDPKNFAKYVVMRFWESNAVYSDSEVENDVFQKNEKIRNIPTVKSFISFDADAYAKYKEADKVIQKNYEVTLQENERRYKVQQAELDVQYQNLVEHRKFELGL